VLALAGAPANLEQLDAWPSIFSRSPKVANFAGGAFKAFPHCPDRLGLYPVLPSANGSNGFSLTVQTAQFVARPIRRFKAESNALVAAGAKPRGAAPLFINDHAGSHPKAARTACISARRRGDAD